MLAPGIQAKRLRGMLLVIDTAQWSWLSLLVNILQAIRKQLCTGALAVSLLGLAAGGCSRHSDVQTGDGFLPAKVTDLGVVDLAPGVAREFDLGGGKTCTMTASHSQDAILVDIAIEGKGVDGSILRQRMPGVQSLPGHKCVVSMGGAAVSFTPTLADK